MRYLGRISIRIYVRAWIHTLNSVRSIVSNISNEHGHPITRIKKLHPLGESYRILPTFYTREYVYFTNAIVSSLSVGQTINAWRVIFIPSQYNIHDMIMGFKFHKNFHVALEVTITGLLSFCSYYLRIRSGLVT